jgi:16S rRNA pseudouridine516 synthase
MGPVGRLDRDSSGLLVLTNDTRLAALLTAPESRVEKEYEVELDAPIAAEDAARLAAGIVLGGRRTRPCRILFEEPSPAGRLRVTLDEGRNRRVRRLFATAGRAVTAATVRREAHGACFCSKRAGRGSPGASMLAWCQAALAADESPSAARLAP